MNHPRSFSPLLVAGLICAGFSSVSAETSRQITLTPPATRDGSNFSRAPFPAARQFDDVKAPNGEAIDASAVQTTRVATVSTEPYLTPTGRVSEPREVIFIPRPTVKDGSNASRAPYQAGRTHDDAQAPNGQAVDAIPGNR